MHDRHPNRGETLSTVYGGLASLEGERIAGMRGVSNTCSCRHRVLRVPERWEKVDDLTSARRCHCQSFETGTHDLFRSDKQAVCLHLLRSPRIRVGWAGQKSFRRSRKLGSTLVYRGHLAPPTSEHFLRAYADELCHANSSVPVLVMYR